MSSGGRDYRNARRAYLRGIVRGYLITNPCVDCGEDDHRVLQFDHVRGQKVREISRIVNERRGLPALLRELEKCVVRCANCHSIATYERHHGRAVP